MKKIMMILMMVFCATLLSSQIKIDSAITPDVFIQAAKMDQIIYEDYLEYETRVKAIQLDTTIEMGSKITDYDIGRMDLFSLYHIDKDLLKEKIESMTRGERIDAINQAIDHYAEKYKVNPILIRAMIKQESNFNTKAVSHKGACGLMQLMPGTARRFKVADIFNPFDNIEGGVKYMRYLLKYFKGNEKFAIAAYNAGEYAVKRHGGIPPYAETVDYIQKVRKHKRGYGS